MLSCLKFLSVLLLLTLLTACGSKGGMDATVIAAPTETALPVVIDGKVLIGGSLQVQGAVFASVSSVKTLAGTPGTAGTADSTGKVIFNQPIGITTNGTDLYVADYNNHTIRKINASSGEAINFAGTPGVPGSDDGDAVGKGALFNHPSAITTDGTYLYVTDSFNFTIRKINIGSGNVEPVAGQAGISGAVDANEGENAKFGFLSGITTDGTYLYVTDSNHTIRKIVINGGATSTLAGTAGIAGTNDGTGTAARFNLPARITTDREFLYVTDFNNRTIRQISIATKEVKTIVGNADAPPGTTDAIGSGPNALFYHLNGITMDGSNLYVTDSFNNTVYKIQKDSPTPWLVTKLAGITGTEGSVDSKDGEPTFDTPIGITTDGINLYVADSGNHTIRKIFGKP